MAFDLSCRHKQHLASNEFDQDIAWTSKTVKALSNGSPSDRQAVLSFAGETDPADRICVQQIEKLLDAKL